MNEKRDIELERSGAAAHSDVEEAQDGPGNGVPAGAIEAVAATETLVMRVRSRLLRNNLETPFRTPVVHHGTDSRETIKHNQLITMRALGLDVDGDDSLRGTPGRVAKMYIDELMYGLDYGNFPKCTIFENRAKYDEMLCVTDITVHSMCEHHFLPFIGKASVAYIPGKYFLGLSKFHRVVDFFCRRPQVQERLTEQISAAFQEILDTEDVAVVIKAEHFCAKLRGVRDSGTTISSKLSGRFRTVPELRSEFLALANGGH